MNGERVRAGGDSVPALTPVERTAELPVSFAQRRLWFLGQMEGPSSTYNIPWLIRLTGHLDLTALEAALNDVVARHEALRTVFPAATGEPRQSVLPAQDARITLERADVPAAELDAAVTAAAGHVFDLASEIPVRARVFRTSADEHVLLLLLHHIACDGWSVGPLGRDLGTAYGARLAGVAPAWDALPVQYADYAVWQHDLLGAADDPESAGARQLAYWRRQLADLPEVLELPTDRERPAVASHRAPLAGRTEDGLDDLVGFFVNTVVLRTDTSDDPTFRELLDRVRATDLEAYGNQDLPFDRLVEELNPTRSTAHHPL
uniref:condensation domain-containing protein n=1 Tax=Streptomyces sp. NRRL S-87 TaxID=1463920 RepID=UPI001F217AEB